MSKKLTPEQIGILNKAISDYKVNEDKEKKAKTRGKTAYDRYLTMDEHKLDSLLVHMKDKINKAERRKQKNPNAIDIKQLDKAKQFLLDGIKAYNDLGFGDPSISADTSSTQSTSSTQQPSTQQPLVQQTPLERIKENYTWKIPQQITKHKNQLIERIIKDDNPNRHEAEIMANAIWEDASKGIPVIINSEKVIWTGEDPNKPSSWIKI